MAVATKLGLVLFVVACLATGMRLLFVWNRTREIPELAIGVALLTAGIANPILAAVKEWIGPHPAGPLLEGLGVSLLAVGSACLWGFAWHVFRPYDTWARVAAAIGALVALLAVVCWGLETGFRGAKGTWFWLAFVFRVLPYAWVAAEAFAYSRDMRKRAKVGMGDPVVANRLMLWGCACSLVVFMFVSVGWTLYQASNLKEAPSSLYLITSVFGMMTAGCMWLAFFPPPAYRAYLTRRATKTV